MAFLDNSGDIILDAVLTEAGRRRMAQGTFSITKFALGDDEVDYSLYNKTHPSGSAYYDLQILQTPIFEAFTQINAGINYGLLPNTATDLLYLPVMKVNELSAVVTNHAAIKSNSGVFYVTDPSGDTGDGATTNISVLLNDNTIDYIQGTVTNGNFVLFETGLDTGTNNLPAGTSENRQSYLVANGLIDNRLLVFYDTRFISSVSGLTAPRENSDVTFTNNNESSEFVANLILKASLRTNISSGLENYTGAIMSGIKNDVVQTSPDNQALYSVINGPRGIVGAVAANIRTDLSAEYDLYGSTTTIDGTPCKIIDTVVYVQGMTSAAQIQIPFRIIKL